MGASALSVATSPIEGRTLEEEFAEAERIAEACGLLGVQQCLLSGPIAQEQGPAWHQRHSRAARTITWFLGCLPVREDAGLTAARFEGAFWVLHSFEFQINARIIARRALARLTSGEASP